MASSVPAAEKALRTLQQLVRRPPLAHAGRVVKLMRLPSDLQTDDLQQIGLFADGVEAANVAISALVADPRFEYLDPAGCDPAGDQVWRFVAECSVDKEDHVVAFVQTHQREPIDAVCYLPVEFLTVRAETEALGIGLFQVDDPRVPPSRPRPGARHLAEGSLSGIVVVPS
jgi:hypothetical protein